VRRKIGVALLVALVVGQLGALLFVGTVEVGAQTDAANSTVEENEIISGLRDPDIRLVDRSSTGDAAVLTIEADRSKTIQVADIVAGADSPNGVGYVTFEPRSLDAGTNKVEVEAATVNGQHAIGVQGSGPQANIYVDAQGSMSLVEMSTTRTALTVYFFAAFFTVLYAYVESKETQEPQRVNA
jgi:hypothetical protein